MVFTYTNRLMEVCLGDLEKYVTSNRSRFKADIMEISRFILSNIVIHQGCYLLKDVMACDFEPKPEQAFTPDRSFPDRTGYECFENHVHTQNMLGSCKAGLHHLAAGVAMAEILRLKLKAFAPAKFRIIVSFPVKPLLLGIDEPAGADGASGQPSEEDSHVRDNCTIRFHAVREGEVVFDDLEAFQFDAMGVVEI